MLMTDIVLQGPLWSKTLDTVKSYLTLAWVNRIIVSTWEDQYLGLADPRVLVVKSKDLANPGDNNRNRQIYTSQVGVNLSTADLTLKTRTDQQIDLSSMQKMYEHFLKNYAIDAKFTDGSGPKGAIFTIGLYSGFVFHPQDHLFLGFREDIQKLFDIPLDPDEPPDLNKPTNYTGATYTRSVTRPNAYLGKFYYARFDDRIKHMSENYREYIVDLAPKKTEAFAAEEPYRNIIFKAFPQINLWWEKYGTAYPYDVGKGYSEYCGESW